jgi:hypothetical protein
VSDNLTGVGEDGRPLVFMRFRPAWAYIEGIREFARFFCETTFKEPELAERARMVIQETLENAVKYSTEGKHSELELSISRDHEHLEISVASLPDPAHYGTLKRQLSEIQDDEPEEAYIKAFERAALNPDKSAQLGLARIRYEGGVELQLRDEDGGRIRIVARGKL